MSDDGVLSEWSKCDLHAMQVIDSHRDGVSRRIPSKMQAAGMI
jgi:hypothetical protein